MAWRWSSAVARCVRGPCAPLPIMHASMRTTGQARLSWARLLKRVFDLDLEHCPNCGGELQVIAATLEAGPGHKRS
jgi:hypothetical protein